MKKLYPHRKNVPMTGAMTRDLARLSRRRGQTEAEVMRQLLAKEVASGRATSKLTP